MDIKGISAPSSHLPDPNARPVTDYLPARAENDAVSTAESLRAEAVRAAQQQRIMALGADVRQQLYVDESTHEVYGRVFDRNSGELLREIPSQELRNLRAVVQELYGSLIDELA